MRVKVAVHVIPGWAVVQALREAEKAKLTPRQRWALKSPDITERTTAYRRLSERFAAAMRKRGWLAEEGYAK